VAFSHRAGVVFAGLLLAHTIGAVEPELRHLRPVAGAQGTTVAVAAVGKVDPWPPHVWVDTPGVQFTPTPVTGVFSVEIAPDAEPGPHLVRFFNEEGASVPRFFIVSTEPESRETEPNDEFRIRRISPACQRPLVVGWTSPATWTASRYR
jgi:hypothetical protein